MDKWGYSAVKRHHDQSNTDKENHIFGAGLQFRSLIHYHYGRKHCTIQVDMVLEKELRVLHLDWQETRRKEMALRLG